MSIWDLITAFITYNLLSYRWNSHISFYRDRQNWNISKKTRKREREFRMIMTSAIQLSYKSFQDCKGSLIRITLAEKIGRSKSQRHSYRSLVLVREAGCPHKMLGTHSFFIPQMSWIHLEMSTFHFSFNLNFMEIFCNPGNHNLH